MQRVQVSCDLCDAAGIHQPELLTLRPGDPLDDAIPSGWVVVSMMISNRALPPALDGMAEAFAKLPIDASAYFAGATVPFQTTVHLCAEHRRSATFAELDAVLQARFKERDEAPASFVPPLPPPLVFSPRPADEDNGARPIDEDGDGEIDPATRAELDRARWEMTRRLVLT